MSYVKLNSSTLESIRESVTKQSLENSNLYLENTRLEKRRFRFDISGKDSMGSQTTKTINVVETDVNAAKIKAIDIARSSGLSRVVVDDVNVASSPESPPEDLKKANDVAADVPNDDDVNVDPDLKAGDKSGDVVKETSVADKISQSSLRRAGMPY